MHMHMCIYIYIYIYVCMYVYIYIYICMQQGVRAALPAPGRGARAEQQPNTKQQIRNGYAI